MNIQNLSHAFPTENIQYNLNLHEYKFYLRKLMLEKKKYKPISTDPALH